MAYKTFWLAGLLAPMMVGFSADVDAAQNKISAGIQSTIFIKDGNVYGMGFNSHGQITSDPALLTTKLGAYSVITKPVFTGITNAKSVYAGQNRTAVLKYDGTVEVSGMQYPGEFYGSAKYAGMFRYKVPASNISDVALTSSDDMYLLSDGILYKWRFGMTAPTAVTNTSHGYIVSLSSSQSGYIALRFKDNTVSFMLVRMSNFMTTPWSMLNAKGEFCIGKTGTTGMTMDAPFKVPLTNIREVYLASQAKSLFLMTDGTVYGCGTNHVGSLGQPFESDAAGLPIENIFPSPVKVTGFSNVKKIMPLGRGIVTLQNDGSLLALGWHNYIMPGSYLWARYAIVKIPDVPPAVDVSSDGVAGQMVDFGQAGQMHGWSDNRQYHLGDGTRTERHVMTVSYYSPLPSSVTKPAPGTGACYGYTAQDTHDPDCSWPVAQKDPACLALESASPFAKIDLAVASMCKVVLYNSMNECLKANANVIGAGQLCKNVIPPDDRGVGSVKKS